MKSIIISLGFLLPFVLNAQGVFSKLEVFAGPGSVKEYGTDFLNKYSKFKAGYMVGVGIIQPLNSKFDINLRFQYELKGTKTSLLTVGTTDMFNNPPTYNGSPIPVTFVSDVKTSYYTVSATPRYRWNKLIGGVGLFYSIFGTAPGSNWYVYNGQVKRKENGSNNFNQTKHDFGLSFQVSYPIFETSGFKFRAQLVDNLGLHNTNINRGSAHLDQKTNILALVLAVSPK